MLILSLPNASPTLEMGKTLHVTRGRAPATASPFSKAELSGLRSNPSGDSGRTSSFTNEGTDFQEAARSLQGYIDPEFRSRLPSSGSALSLLPLLWT